VHIDEAEASRSASSGKKDGVHNSNYPDVRKLCVTVWLSHCKCAVQVVCRNRVTAIQQSQREYFALLSCRGTSMATASADASPLVNALQEVTELKDARTTMFDAALADLLPVCIQNAGLVELHSPVHSNIERELLLHG
jgi:hypothetical protein